ncbi:hypothetical protein NRK82_000364 [Escherichia coli]|nr:hypothetical protein [Escherichia coli]
MKQEYELTVATQSADVRPEAVAPIYDLVKAAHQLTWQQAPKSSGPLNDSDLEQQIEDEF